MFKSDVKESHITPEEIFWDRRRFIQRMGLASAGGLVMPLMSAEIPKEAEQTHYVLGEDLKSEMSSEFVVTHHNNFYEFSTDKQEPARLAAKFKPTTQWKITCSGEIEVPGTYVLEDFIKWFDIEERIYRFRCVEAWSMVIPWQGFELSQLIKKLKPNAKAKFVEFKTLHDEEIFPGQKRGVFGMHTLPWPYVEGLTIAEAMNPLTMIATGVYGKDLPGQNGAPLRLVVPWKYGFKSIKSIVSIHFSEEQPISTWNQRAPNEYGFYANVNPKVDHPRWSQASERRISDESFFGVKRIPTKMFNGYESYVSDLYKHIDLTKYF